MTETSIELARRIITKYKRLGDLLGGVEEPVRNPDELLSHGCYNQNIMKHVRPEHDYRNPEPKRFLKVEATYVFSGKAKVPTLIGDDYEKAFMEDTEILPSQLKHLADLKKRDAESRAAIDEYENPTCRNFRQVQNPLPSSVIPWMSNPLTVDF